MDAKQYVGYGFGAVVIILLIVAIFTFTFNQNVENEYFNNYLELSEHLNYD